MSEPRTRPHIALGGKTLKKPSRRRWSKKGEEEIRYYSNVEELRVSLNNIRDSVESREKKVRIYDDPNLYFEISIRGKVYWQYIQRIFDKLSLRIKNIISDKKAIFSLNKKNYERFHTMLIDHLDIIETINEVGIYQKISEDIYDELKGNPSKIDYYTIEFSDMAGLVNPRELDSDFQKWITENKGELTLNYFSENMILYTVEITNEKLITIVETLDSISHIERKPQFTLHNNSNLQLNFIKDKLIEPIQLEELPIICIIDSGINLDHKKLGKFIEATYDFTTEDPYPCEDIVGHGTWVTGFAIYGEDPTINIKPTSKVIMVKNFIDASTTVIDDINAIQTILDIFPNQFKIINLSYSTNGPNSSLTKALDKIVFNNELVLVTSSGNIHQDIILYNINQGIPYPNYLRRYLIYYPGDCRNVMTVGSCTHRGTKLAPNLGPSPFTRSSPYRNILKPDLVEIGGNIDIIKGSRAVALQMAGYGVSTTSHIGSGYIERHGSSFSSPIVANMFARLYSRLKIDSPALLKALLLSSCTRLCDQQGDHFDVELQGFGKPNFEHALSSNYHRVSYLLEGQFSSRFPRLFDRYDIWFPVGADEVEVTLVCDKSETMYENEEQDYITIDVVRRAGTGGRTEFVSLAGNQNCCNTYKGRFEVSRGSRGAWTFDIIPKFFLGDVFPLRMRYGCVVTIKDNTTSNNIWKNVYDDWLSDLIEPTLPTDERLESRMEPLRPVLIEKEVEH